MSRLLMMGTLLAACGGGGGGGSDPDRPDGGGGGSGDGRSGAPPYFGNVGLSNFTGRSGSTAIESGSAYAQFTVFSAGSTCTTTEVGACTLSHCVQGGTPTFTHHSAGTVTIAGAATPLALAPKADGAYDGVSLAQRLFVGGETLAFTATGGAVPAFSLSIVAPVRPMMTTPAWSLDSSTAYPLPRSQPLQLAWIGTGAGTLTVGVSGVQGSGKTMSCELPLSAGSASIPASALAMLPAGEGQVSVSAEGRSSVDVGDWRIYGSATTTAVWSDGTIASVKVSLQ